MKSIKICCIGAGYVGGPTMAVIAEMCPEINVTVVDINKSKIDSWNGDINQLPVYEPGLKEIIKKVRNKNLFFSVDIENSIKQSEIIFIAVNTPTKTEGEGAGMAADLTFVIKTAEQIAKYSISDKIVVEKSTLPVRTAEEIKKILNKLNNKVKFEVLSNPEFLAEGTAIQDLYKSDRVLIGGDNTKSGKIAIDKLVSIYQKWIPKEKIITSNVWSAELSKLSSNAMLAQRISSINSLSALCEKTGAKIQEVSSSIGKDHRIGEHFLKFSVGFGGSCFKKDILNLVYLCKKYGLNEVAEYWHQVVKINDYQKLRFSNLIIDYLKNIKNKKASILGWAFKKNTNDSRESAAIDVAFNLLLAGIRTSVYDPMVNSDKIRKDLKNLFTSKGIIDINSYLSKLTIHESIDNCISNSSAIAIITEWDEFKNYPWDEIQKISNSEYKIFDGRGIVDTKIENRLYKIGN